jgi:hypothetical protein
VPVHGVDWKGQEKVDYLDGCVGEVSKDNSWSGCSFEESLPMGCTSWSSASLVQLDEVFYATRVLVSSLETSEVDERDERRIR